MKADPDKLKFLFTCTDQELADFLADHLEAFGARGVDRVKLISIVAQERMGIINWIMSGLPK